MEEWDSNREPEWNSSREPDKVNEYTLTDSLRMEGMSRTRWNEWFEEYKDEAGAAERGFDTIYDEYDKNVCGHKYERGMRATVMSVESKITPPEKREFFKPDNRRGDRPEGRSYGSRGQPTPDPESAESIKYCAEINWSEVSEEDEVELLCAPCEEHPPMEGDDTHHLNFQCCSCFHRMRESQKMLIKASDKSKDWKAMANADREARKQARFAVQHKADLAMDEQEWIPTHVKREITNREEKRKQKNLKRFKPK